MMSEAIFPSFPGLTWDVSKTPEFFSLSKTSPTGVDVSASLGAYPRWHFSLAYEFLKDREDEATNELHRLLGFFLQRHGSVDDFLFLDPTDNAVLTPQIFGVGDGVTKEFQLCRSLGGFAEPVLGTVSGSEVIYIDGNARTGDVSISKGVAIFQTPPALNQKLSWTGNFYFRCRFKENTMEFKNFAFRLWEAKSVEFTSIKRLLS